MVDRSLSALIMCLLLYTILSWADCLSLLAYHYLHCLIHKRYDVIACMVINHVLATILGRLECSGNNYCFVETCTPLAIMPYKDTHAARVVLDRLKGM